MDFHPDRAGRVRKLRVFAGATTTPIPDSKEHIIYTLGAGFFIQP